MNTGFKKNIPIYVFRYLKNLNGFLFLSNLYVNKYTKDVYFEKKILKWPCVKQNDKKQFSLKCTDP